MAETTGLKTVTRLRKYINGKATTETKVNQSSDPDYIEPYTDTRSCPLYVYDVPTPAPTPAPAPGTTPTPTPSPSPTPVPVFVPQEEPIPDQTTCNPCVTLDVANTECAVYLITNRDPVRTSYFQITDCSTGQKVSKIMYPDTDREMESLTEPFLNSGAEIDVEFVEWADGFSDVDINKNHYETINCYNNKEMRIVRTTRQLNKGQVVKTENSSCCWEVREQVSPQQAHNVIINSTTPIYSECSECCTDPAVVPDKSAVITGTTSINVNCSNSVNQTGIFNVEAEGEVEVKIEVDVTTGEYVYATGRLLLNNAGIYTQYVSFPSNPYGWPPYVINGRDQSGPTIETKTITLPVGIYKLQLEPLDCASGAFGTATLSVRIL